MATGPPTIVLPSSTPSSTLFKTLLRTDIISVTLKFGFQQKQIQYASKENTSTNSIIDKIYRDAELWLRTMASNLKTSQIVDRYTLYLFRIPSADLTMVPIAQISDIEQNCLIELVVVPIEINTNPHALYRCQLNVPTNCSKCSRFIAGLYKQGFRCRKCRMTYHKDCAPFLIDDCPAPSTDPPMPNAGGPPSSPTRKASLPTFLNPFITAPIPSAPLTTTIVPIYTNSTTTFSLKENDSSTIIDEGIFPAYLQGSNVYRRCLFRLTSNSLLITTNLTANTQQQQQQMRPSNDVDIFPLSEIIDVKSTHIGVNCEHIFELYFAGKIVLCVGKKSDSEDLQMQTAQFYSSIRDQCEALANGPPSTAPPISTTTTVTTTAPSTSVKNTHGLKRKQSIYRRPPQGRDTEDKDLHELYAFTGEKIGEGQFGRVVGAYRKSNNVHVAIKCIEKANCSEDDIRRTNEEIEYLYKFNHLNILKLEAYFERDDAIYIVTERMETDMCKYIMASKNKYLEESMCKMLIYQVLVALRYLHSNNCGHLDVKCENVLISFLRPLSPTTNKQQISIDLPLVKLADFGYARIIGEHSFRKTRVGTKVYCAPEVYRSKEGYNRLVDMWSVGIVLYAALSGTLPYDENGVHRADEIVRDTTALYADRRWKSVSREAIDLISNKLLIVQPGSRLKAMDALFHAWFTDYHLYKNLREIEKRTEHDLSIKQQQQQQPFPLWLTGEREDHVWNEFRTMFQNQV